MSIGRRGGSFSEGADTPIADSTEIVMGLHWDPPDRTATELATDLDALCVVFDRRNRILEVVHPGRQRSADGSIVHTGDSKNGASLWDDERIFVFLAALPESVEKLAFVVANTTERCFDEIRGSYCHVSDRVSEKEFVRHDLTALPGKTIHAVASIHRDAARWTISTGDRSMTENLLAELRSSVANAKSGEAMAARPAPLAPKPEPQR